MDKLKEGDVIELKDGHHIYIRLPEHFCYGNRIGVFNKLSETVVCVGQNKSGLKTNFLKGRWVVYATAYDGGSHGGGMSGNDFYQNGYHVFIEKIIHEIGNPRIRASFYQTGSFTAMIEDIKPVGRAKATWNIEG